MSERKGPAPKAPMQGGGPRGGRGFSPPQPLDKKALGRLMGYLKPYWPRLLLVLVCVILNAVATARAATFLGTVIDDYITPLLGTANPDFSGLLSAILRMAALYGLAIGVVLAFGLACAMDRFLNLERAVLPLLVASQTIPTIAIAPLLVLWMGFGVAPKIALVVITTFFPVAVGLLDGFKSADPDAVSLLRSMGATRRKIFRHVKWPAALPYFFAGLRISASYAVVGAVISEWLGGFEGLGVYMTRVRKAYAFDKMFAVIILVVIVSLLLMRLVTLLRAVSMPWLRKDPDRAGALRQS